MQKIFFIILIVFSGLSLTAQTNLDSLYTVWQDHTQPDSIRTNAYESYIWDGFLFSNPDTAFVLAQSLLRFGEEQQYEKAKSLAHNLMGTSNYLKADYPKALEYYQRSLKISEEIGDKPGSASTISNIGIIYKNQGNYSKALDYYQRSLKIQEEIGDTRGSAATIGNIGNIYQALGDYPIALDYFQRSLKIVEEIGDKQVSANTIGNIGIIYENKGDYPKALEYFQRSLKIYEEMGNKEGSARTIGNIGLIYKNQGDYTKALEYFQRSLNSFEEMGIKEGSALTINTIGLIYKNQGDYPKALEYCKLSLVKSEEIAALNLEKDACQCLYDTYKAMGKGIEALVYLEKLQVIDDSLNAEETNKKLQQMEFAKQVLADSIATAEKERLVQEAHEEEIHQEEKTRNISLGVGAFFVLLAGSFYIRWRYVRKSKVSLQIEKDRSESLLLNILPEEVAQELKETGKAAPKKYESVTILFTDFKDFTKLVASIPATTLIVELDDIFGQFDDIMDEVGVEKIETIGDAYMAASGLPRENPDHALRCVEAAFRMVEFLEQRNENSEISWNMRVGIHSGPVVAGVVGKKKFAYDLFGDSVNTASRMESNGEVGKVNISQATYELLKSNPDFAFENRGKIEAKGKGEIEMYFVSKK